MSDIHSYRGTKRIDVGSDAAAKSNDAPQSSADLEGWYQSTLARAKRYRALVEKRQAEGEPVPAKLKTDITRQIALMGELKEWLDNHEAGDLGYWPSFPWLV